VEWGCARALCSDGITVGAACEADGAWCRGGFAGACAWLPRYSVCDEMFLWPHLMWVVGVSNRSVLPLFILVVFTFPCTHLLFAFLALVFPFCLGKYSPRSHRHSYCYRSAFLPFLMDPWGRSSFTEKIVLRLVEDGLLRPMTNIAQLEWIVPGNEDELNPPSAMSSALRTSMSGSLGRL
jgi:hypothetical protein